MLGAKVSQVGGQGFLNSWPRFVRKVHLGGGLACILHVTSVLVVWWCGGVCFMCAFPNVHICRFGRYAFLLTPKHFNRSHPARSFPQGSPRRSRTTCDPSTGSPAPTWTRSSPCSRCACLSYPYIGVPFCYSFSTPIKISVFHRN